LQKKHKDKIEVPEQDQVQSEPGQDEKHGSKLNAKIALLEAQIADLDKQLQQKDEEVKQEKDKTLRTLAETENFKKRKEQEKEDFCKFANEKMVKDLLPVLDSFDYAVEHAQKAQNDKKNSSHENVIAGFILIQKQLHSFLEKIGVCSIESLNLPFDPNHHQAVMQEENKDVEENTVIKEMQKGYKFNSRIIRPSMVVVSK
jgi:molecular chaperone GrpE